jgi:hypothetical protein
VYIFDSFVLKNTHNHTRKNVRQLLSLQFFTKAQAKANTVKLFRRHHASDPRWESKKKWWKPMTVSEGLSNDMGSSPRRLIGGWESVNKGDQTG